MPLNSPQPLQQTPRHFSSGKIAPPPPNPHPPPPHPPPPAIAALISICLDPGERAQFPQTSRTVPENIREGQFTLQEAVGSRHGYSSFIKRALLAWVQVYSDFLHPTLFLWYSSGTIEQSSHMKQGSSRWLTQPSLHEENLGTDLEQNPLDLLGQQDLKGPSWPRSPSRPAGPADCGGGWKHS